MERLDERGVLASRVGVGQVELHGCLPHRQRLNKHSDSGLHGTSMMASMKRMTSRVMIALCGTACLAAGPLAMAQMSETFDASDGLPSGWIGGVTGTGSAKWEVIVDSSAPSASKVLRQSGQATFAWAVASKAFIRDGFVEVKFKPIAGREDQAGGLVFRYRDANNYYVVRANALEDNVVLYKTVDGKRSSLRVKGRMFGYGVDADVPQNRWNTLRVDFAGGLFTVTFQGKQLFQVEDDTFSGPGAVGVWTKADSVTAFDDFRVGSTSRP